MQLSRYFVY